MRPFFGLAHALLGCVTPDPDGGIAGFLLDIYQHKLQPNTSDVLLLSQENASSLIQQENATVIDHFWTNCCNTTSAMFALVLSVAWICGMLVLSCLVCIVHARPLPPPTSRRTTASPPAASSQEAFSIVNLVCIFICISFVVLFMANAILLGHFMGKTLPRRLNTSMHEVHSFVMNLAPNAARDTAGDIEDLIQHTTDFNAVVDSQFNDVLQEALGSKKVLQFSKALTNYILTLFKHMRPLFTAAQTNAELINQMKNHLIDFKDELRYRGAILCPDTDVDHCGEVIRFFVSRLFVSRSLPFLTFQFAQTFMYLMESQKETEASVRKQLQDGLDLADNITQQSKQKVADKMQLPAVIRNSTGSIWSKMHAGMVAMEPTFANISLMLEQDVRPKLETSNSILVVLFTLFALFLLLVLVALAWLNVAWLPLRGVNLIRFPVPPLVYIHVLVISAVMIAISVLLATPLYLTTRYAEIHACRYFRPYFDAEGLAKNSPYHTVLDTRINSFLTQNWAGIEDLAKKNSPMAEEFPLPRVKNIIQGIAVGCQQENVSILTALDAIRDMDVSAMSQPEVSEMMMKKGRDLMLEILTERDPQTLVPAETRGRLDDAVKLEMFEKANYSEIQEQLVHEPLVLDKNDLSVVSPVTVDQEFQLLMAAMNRSRLRGASISENIVHEVLVAYRGFREPVDSFKKLMSEISSHLESLRQVESIRSIVRELNNSMEFMLALMTDHPRLLKLAGDLFDEKVVPKTTAFQNGLMSKFAPRMMSRVAPCRALHQIYVSSVTLFCDDMLGAVANLWLFLGSFALVASVPVIVLIVHFITRQSSLNDETPTPARVMPMRRRERSKGTKNLPVNGRDPLEVKLKTTRNLNELKQLLNSSDSPTEKL